MVATAPTKAFRVHRTFMLLKDILKEHFSPAMILTSPLDVLGEAVQVIESRKNCIFAYFPSKFYTVNPYWNFGKVQFLASRVIRYFLASLLCTLVFQDLKRTYSKFCNQFFWHRRISWRTHITSENL